MAVRIEAKIEGTSVHLGRELSEIVKKLALRAGKTPSDYLRRLVLDAIEDAEDGMIADEAMEEFRRNGEKAIPSAQVRRELGLDD